MIEVRKKLREILERREIKPIEIARLCGHGSSWISQLLNVENKKYQNQNILISDLIKIVNYLKIDVAELLPVPKKIDVEKMSLIDLMRLIARKECEKYLKENGIIKQGE